MKAAAMEPARGAGADLDNARAIYDITVHNIR